MRHIDTHTHLDCPDFDADRQKVITDAHAGGVVRILVMGITSSHWDRLWHMVSSEPSLFAAFGLHPVFINEHRPGHIALLRARLESLAGDPHCCAVGEIGLDYLLTDLDRERQQHVLEAQLKLASDFNLPVLLHVRRAHAQMIATLKRYRLARAGIVHAFAGSREEAREYIKLGFKLGLGGAATWEQATRLRRVIAELPATSLVLETDAPDMSPAFNAHQRNSPVHLPRICEILATLRGETPEQLAEACLNNTCELFGWDPTAVY
ncbi:MAG TPA: TatD family deoxyribonuclease [Pseudomonas xinjiangensis]|uniref:TatD family deoxyribonuclease n=2 Tax=root TaxID=1 RepID=A0A7V1BNJ4_9GAMM|nr:TatD family deoxyribonuclease [Halopseudomonas xinjiangensis]HEC48574.1 TatD family deoxyribonuclease [Halopseudomonas xinjiangensis]